MIRSGLYGLFFLTTYFVSAQENSNGFPKRQQAGIFNIYQTDRSEFFGIFDSTESAFVVHCQPAVQSQFDSSCLLSGGKAWHRGQLTTLTTYLTIDTVLQVFPVTDTNSEITEHWAFTLPEMKKPGNTLWKCDGEFSMNEDPGQQYSGKFMGTFSIYFMYNPKNGTLLPLPQAQGFGLEPGYAFYGFWRSYSKESIGAVAFFFANTQPQPREDGSKKLPDLRFQQDGSSSFSNIVIFPSGASTPPANWFQ